MTDGLGTHLDKLQRVRLRTKGEHPIMVEWHDADGFHNETVYVIRAGEQSVTLARDLLENFPTAALLRVNGALTSAGQAYYDVVAHLEQQRGRPIRFRYAKARTGEVKEYAGIVLQVVDRQYLGVRVGQAYKQFLIPNLELL